MGEPWYGTSLVVCSDSLLLQDCVWSCLVARSWHFQVKSVGQCAGLLHEVLNNSCAVAVSCVRRLLCVPGPVLFLNTNQACWLCHARVLFVALFQVSEALPSTEHCMLTEPAAMELHADRLRGCSF